MPGVIVSGTLTAAGEVDLRVVVAWRAGQEDVELDLTGADRVEFTGQGAAASRRMNRRTEFIVLSF